MKNQPKLRIAIQKSGRLNEPSMDFLKSLGLSFPPNGKSLIHQCENFDLEVLYLRDDDIPEYVSRGVADFGIVGQNVLLEKEVHLPILKELGFGKCSLVIAVPEKSPIKKSKHLDGERISTSYPRLLTKYLTSKNVESTIIPISGSAEITPGLNLSDAICDIVQTGKTLKANKLVSIFKVLESQAVLIESPHINPNKKEFLNLWPKI